MHVTDIYEGYCRTKRTADEFYLFVDLGGQADTDGLTDGLTFDIYSDEETITAIAEYNGIENPEDIGNSVGAPRIHALVRKSDDSFELAVDQMMD